MASDGGLRERKRVATMRRIQEAALDLFDRGGYESVTVEQIAEAAEVSPSSVYRYFGTKEQLVLHDELDLELMGLLHAELAAHPPMEAARRAVAAAMTGFFGRDEALARRKIRYWAEEPAIQVYAAAQTEQFAQLLAATLSAATKRKPDDLDLQVIAAVLVWSMVTATRHWHTTGYRRPLEEELERALVIVERGLTLDEDAPGSPTRPKESANDRPGPWAPRR